MKPTSAALLVGSFLAAGVLVDLLLRVTYDKLPPLPGGPVITALIIAIVELGLAWTTRNRLQGKNNARPMEPLQVARFAVLARASSLVGAVLAGAWTGTLVYLAGQRGSLDAVSHDRRLAIAGIVASAALAGAALWLEWTCRIPPPPEEKGVEHQRHAA